jgi:hypothetical protein
MIAFAVCTITFSILEPKKNDFDLAAMVIGVFAFGLLMVYSVCVIARPQVLAARVRERYNRSGPFLQNWPFANQVLRPWYPTYLRWWGILVLAFGVSVSVVFLLAAVR